MLILFNNFKKSKIKNCQKIFDKYWEFDLKIRKTLKKFCNSKESLIIASILLEKFIFSLVFLA